MDEIAFESWGNLLYIIRGDFHIDASPKAIARCFQAPQPSWLDMNLCSDNFALIEDLLAIQHNVAGRIHTNIADELKVAAQSHTHYTIRNHLHEQMRRANPLADLTIRMTYEINYHQQYAPWFLSFFLDWLRNASDAPQRPISEISNIQCHDDVRFITRFLLTHTSKCLAFSELGITIIDSDLTAINAWLQQDQQRSISLIPSAVDMEADVFPLPVGELVISGHISRAEAVKLVASITGPVKVIQVQYTHMGKHEDDPSRLQHGGRDISSLVGPDTTIHAYGPVVLRRLNEHGAGGDVAHPRSETEQFAVLELVLFRHSHAQFPSGLAQSTINCPCEIVSISHEDWYDPSSDRPAISRILHGTQCLHVQLEDDVLLSLERTHPHVRAVEIILTFDCPPPDLTTHVLPFLRAARARFPRVCHVYIGDNYDPSLATLVGYYSMGAERPYYTTANDRKPLMDSIKWFYKSYRYHHHNDAWRDMLLLIWHLVYAASMAGVPMGACAIPAGVWPHLFRAFYLSSCQQLLEAWED
eukprot:TRINITY_DN12487_c1_g2_i1.p1 TRINITY_DN12487_c1_g2~~TRINITY_DN12487_c1_g2_i1.p1  ORF type:complete len:572 (+),score=20.56 TRINITY_DN12487_c1_g2_i1:132-1718(+)